MAQLLDGKKVSDTIAQRLTDEISRSKRVPCLAIVQVGHRVESDAYIKRKKAFAERIGARVRHEVCDERVSEEELIARIGALNEDQDVDGILVQLPIPPHLEKDRIIAGIHPQKDVDGLTSASVDALLRGRPKFVSATPKGIMSLLRAYNIPVQGKHVVIVGRSMLVGKPAALLFLSEDATVTVAHSKTENLPLVTRAADILIVAIGSPHFIGKEHVRIGQVVIDVGINDATEKLDDEIGGRTLVGDVDFESVMPVVDALSPVPGGVGPMTVASLFENLLLASSRKGM